LEEKLSVRETEKLVKALNNPKEKKEKEKKPENGDRWKNPAVFCCPDYANAVK